MLSGHLKIADDVHISGGTAITADISVPGRYTGVLPFATHSEWQRNAAVIGQLSHLRKRLRQLERK
jgi:UDP-3-O-[3-hydroxymyristoyl] glucosamine N-acyltransferase